MRKVLVYIGLVVVFAMAFIATAATESQAATRVPGHVCASAKVYNHLHSDTARQCKRQGFYYEKGTWPKDITTSPWTMDPYVIVIGPHGRIWVDTDGFCDDFNPNVVGQR